MPTKRTVTTVKEFEYSKDGKVLKETVTQTTEEQELPVSPWRQGPHVHFPPRKVPYDHGGFGGHLHVWDSEKVISTTMNGYL